MHVAKAISSIFYTTYKRVLSMHGVITTSIWHTLLVAPFPVFGVEKTESRTTVHRALQNTQRVAQA